MLLSLLVFGSCVVIAASIHSSNAGYVEELIRNNAFGSRISTNITEDALLALPDLVRKYEYPFEEHLVTTEDGYILAVHRIPHGRNANILSGDKPVVFLMHGLLSSSGENIIMGPESGLGKWKWDPETSPLSRLGVTEIPLESPDPGQTYSWFFDYRRGRIYVCIVYDLNAAYILAEEGFDVWLGNARGNYFSRRHISLNPDARFNSTFWDFSWDEIGNFDLPAMIDYVLEYTGRSRLHYIGFSQGTTSFFVMGSLRPKYNEKIITMHALAPVAYMAHNRNRVFLALAPHTNEIMTLSSLLGIKEFLPYDEFYTKLGLEYCSDGSKFQPICSEFLFLIAGRSVDQHNATTMPLITGHFPAGAALQQFAHYGQSIVGKEFLRYDYGAIRNLIKYGRISPPKYDLSKISAPVFLYYSQRDPFAAVVDVERLYRELGNPIGKYLVEDKNFSHLDFIWGIHARTLVHNNIIEHMRIFDMNEL